MANTREHHIKEAEKIIDQLKNDSNLTLLEKKRLQEQFWSHIKETPLISKNENGKYKVIFVYQLDKKADVKLDSLDLKERLVDSQGRDKFLEQIPGTNIYYLELDNLPADTIVPYEYEVNGGKSEQDYKNSKSFNMPIYDSEKKETRLNTERTTSILALPEAKPQLWSQNYIAEKNGLIRQTILIEDGEFGKRPIWIYTPPDFNPSKKEPYQLMLVLDGHTYIGKLPAALDAMCANNPALANTVVAIIGNVDPHSVPNRSINPNERSSFEENRKYEYIDHSNEFAKFITGRILPTLQHDNALNVSKKPEDNYLTGFSMAGHFTAEVGLNHADKIVNLICLSGAFNNRNVDLIEQYTKASPLNLNVYLSIGTFEDRVPDTTAQKNEGLANMSRREANQRFKSALVGKVRSVELEQFPVGHSELTTIQSIGSGISFIQQQKELQSKQKKESEFSSQSLFSQPRATTISDKQSETIWVHRKKGG